MYLVWVSYCFSATSLFFIMYYVLHRLFIGSLLLLVSILFLLMWTLLMYLITSISFLTISITSLRFLCRCLYFFFSTSYYLFMVSYFCVVLLSFLDCFFRLAFLTMSLSLAVSYYVFMISLLLRFSFVLSSFSHCGGIRFASDGKASLLQCG